ncbi:MAG: MmgE/PrpD family protein [Betaproteobacteria bacterium]|nr:MmgE/PrpD family protein [Betaproteobacteria bacterium]
MAGYDAVSRIGLALGEIEDRGFRTSGIAGAAIASGLVLVMSHEQIMNTLRIACSSAAGLRTFTPRSRREHVEYENEPLRLSMPTAAQVLAKFAAELKFEDIPPAVVRRAKDCIADTVAAAIFGSTRSWSRMAVDYARRYGGAGRCSIIGIPDLHVHAPYAALANGVSAHAFELDSVGKANCGTHPGATLVPALLAACEEAGADGRTAITAFVAGCEVAVRIGAASRHSSENLGFHAPGLNGPYAAAVAAGVASGLGAGELANALGIAGSLSCGLLAFTKSQHGAMVKRLHLGRASESGVLAARLAGGGYAGPETVLEGKFGFLDAYCRDGDANLLTEDLNRTWETLHISMKRYACHLYAHTPVQAVRELMSEHGFGGADVAQVVVEGSPVLLSHHDISEPGDIMKAQYSVPFCVALALFRDPEDPRSFDGSALEDSAIRAACRRVELRALGEPPPSARVTRVRMRLHDGRELVRGFSASKGMEDDPFDRETLQRKFMRLTAAMGEDESARLFERLQRIEAAPRFTMATGAA